MVDLFISLFNSSIISFGNLKIELFTFSSCHLFLYEIAVLFWTLSLKSALDRNDVENDQEVSDEIPSDARILVNNLVVHVCRDIRKLFFAITPVNEINDLGVEIDSGARAAVAIKQEAAKAALARVRLLIVLVVESEDEPAHVQRMQGDHEVKT